MSLITYNGLVELVERGVIEGVEPGHINSASIDVMLGPILWAEDPRGGRVRLARKETPAMIKIDIAQREFDLRPGEFVLAQTKEVFNLPTDMRFRIDPESGFSVSAEFRLKSSTARAGLDQALAVWCDAGWHGSVLTMELRNNLNHHILVLNDGLKVGQMVFWYGKPVPEDKSYAVRGQYCNDREAQPSKGIR